MEESRICIVPEFPLSLMTGGTLVQAIETRKALAKHVTGMRFELFNWSDTQDRADCYHFIGLPKYLAGICSLVAQAKRPYVVTVLMGSPERGKWWLGAWRRRIACWLGRSREHQLALERATNLIAITTRDAEAISAIFRVPASRIRVVPVAVSAVFFGATPELWTSQYGSQPFVLCVGAIQKRKNQLLLVRICNKLQLPVVLVGTILPGESAYAEQVKHAIAENEKLGGRWLRCDDNMLASAYVACKGFALLSDSETQPASVLQAMALRKPVLLADAAYAAVYPFDRLLRTTLREGSEIEHALLKLWSEQPPSELPEEFTEPKVCQMLASIYSSILKNELR